MIAKDIEVLWEEECPWISREQVFYVEREYDESVNESILHRYKDIRELYQSQGLQFMYLPKLKDEVGRLLMSYVGGRGYDSSSCQAYEGIIPQQVLQHVTCPCLIHYVPGQKTFFIAIFQQQFDEQAFRMFLRDNAENHSLKPGAPFPEDIVARVIHFSLSVDDSADEEESAKKLHKTSSRVPHEPTVRYSREPDERPSRVAEEESATIITPSERDHYFEPHSTSTKESKKSSGRFPSGVVGALRNCASRLFVGEFCEEDEDEEHDSRFSLSTPTEDEMAIMADEENIQLLHDMVILWQRLEKKGIRKEFVLKLMKNVRQPIKLRVSSFGLYLGDSFREMKLAPMERAFYLLFLLHPEGIDYKELVDHKDELLKIYRALGARGNRKSQETTVENFCNPTKNMPSISASRIKHAFNALLDEDLAEQYLISGPVGGKKRIALDRSLVDWADETLCAVLKIKETAADHEEENPSDEAPLQKLAKKVFGKD